MIHDCEDPQMNQLAWDIKSLDVDSGNLVEGSAHTSSEAYSFLRLPNELWDHVFFFLDQSPPSRRDFMELPRAGWTESSSKPLKTISTVSWRARLIVLPRLFRHARLDPAHLTQFLEFVDRADLSSKIESVVAHLPGPYSHVHPAWWSRLLNKIPAIRLTIGCEPHILSEIGRLPLNMNDSWAFNIPYQYLELEQSSEDTSSRISYDALPSLFGAKPWVSLKVNEGSSLAAYTTYEYFLKKPPSLLSNIQTYLRCVPAGATPAVMQKIFTTSALSIVAAQSMLENLREFSYVAIFPFYNHVDDILKCIRRMTNLRCLSIKLCPEPDSSVLDDEIRAAKGHIDLNDPWAEVTTAYNLIPHTVNFLDVEGQLITFITDDVKVQGIRDSIRHLITQVLPASWSHDGNATWTKNTPGPLVG